MPSLTTFLDKWNKCIVCGKNNSSNSAFCDCNDYIGDAEALIIALSSNAYSLSDLYKYIINSRDFKDKFKHRFTYQAFYNPFIAAADFIINSAKEYKYIERVEKRSAQNKKHYEMLPVLFEYLRDMVKLGTPSNDFIHKKGAELLTSIVDLTILYPSYQQFKKLAEPFRKSHYFAYNTALHLICNIYNADNIRHLDERFINAFIEVLPQVKCQDFRISSMYAKTIAEMFCYSRCLSMDGKTPLDPEAIALINSFNGNYRLSKARKSAEINALLNR